MLAARHTAQTEAQRQPQGHVVESDALANGPAGWENKVSPDHKGSDVHSGETGCHEKGLQRHYKAFRGAGESLFSFRLFR